MRSIPLKIYLINIVIIASSICYIWIHHDNNFVSENFKSYTSIKDFIVRCEYNSQHNSYIEAIISNNDKKALLKKYNFQDTLDMRGEIPTDFISQQNDYQYFKLKRLQSDYNYILIAIEKEGNIVKVYEEYGD